MSRLIELPLAAGGAVRVEVADDGGPTMRGGASREALLERATQTLEQSASSIAPALRGLLSELRGVSRELSEIELEVGLKVTGEAGMVLARAGTEANFLVRLTWQRPPTETVPPQSSDSQSPVGTERSP